MSSDPRASRYAVPMSALVASAHVPLGAQSTEQALPPVPDWAASTGSVAPLLAGEGDGD